MGYRDRSTNEKSGTCDYCVVEVRLRKKGADPGAKEDLRLLTVDSHWDTLRFVQENMEQFVGNIVKMKRSESHAAERVNENAALFERKLKPLISSLAAANREGVMDKMSASLKKALLIMVMERYKSDRDTACRVLGISREKLESELQLCGVSR